MSSGGRKTDVFVGNIPYGTTEDQLHRIFTEAGRVKNIRMVVDHETGKPKGYAFVEFEDAATALSAIRNLNGYECNGRQLRVNYCSNSSLSKATKSDAQNGAGSQSANAHTIQDVVDGLTAHEMYDIVAGVKEFLENSTDQAKQMLTAHPQVRFAGDKVAEALLLMQIRLGMAKPGEIPPAVRSQPQSHLQRGQAAGEDAVSRPEQNSVQQPQVPPLSQVQQQPQAPQRTPIIQQQHGHQHLQEPQQQYTQQPYQKYTSQTKQSRYTPTPAVQQPAQQSLGPASQQQHTSYGSHGSKQMQRSTTGGASGGRGEYSHYAPPLAQAHGGVVDEKYGGLNPPQQQQLPQKQQQPPQQQQQPLQQQGQLPPQQTRWPPSNSRDPRLASQQHQQPQQITRTHSPNVMHQQQQPQQQWGGDQGLHKQQWGDQGAQLHQGTQSQQLSLNQQHYTAVPPQHQQQYPPTHLQQPQQQQWGEHGKQLAPHQQVGGNYPAGQQQQQQQQQQLSYSHDARVQQNWRGHQQGGRSTFG